ncbi:unnamed protein product, partial [Mesorhabditis spiculigera]
MDARLERTDGDGRHRRRANAFHLVHCNKNRELLPHSEFATNWRDCAGFGVLCEMQGQVSRGRLSNQFCSFNKNLNSGKVLEYEVLPLPTRTIEMDWIGYLIKFHALFQVVRHGPHGLELRNPILGMYVDEKQRLGDPEIGSLVELAIMHHKDKETGKTAWRLSAHYVLERKDAEEFLDEFEPIEVEDKIELQTGVQENLEPSIGVHQNRQLREESNRRAPEITDALLDRLARQGLE